MSFPAAATVRIDDSIDYLNVEGWDRPEVEATVIKSTDHYYEAEQQEQAARRLDRIAIVAERRSTELEISTILPSRGDIFSPPLPSTTKLGVKLEYQIRIARDSRLIIHHRGGLLFVSNMAGDVEATSSSGDIVLALADDSGKCSIDAKSRFGSVSSDFGLATIGIYWVVGLYARIRLPLGGSTCASVLEASRLSAPGIRLMCRARQIRNSSSTWLLTLCYGSATSGTKHRSFQFLEKMRVQAGTNLSPNQRRCPVR